MEPLYTFNMMRLLAGQEARSDVQCPTTCSSQLESLPRGIADAIDPIMVRSSDAEVSNCAALAMLVGKDFFNKDALQSIARTAFPCRMSGS
jgi:hypothetical protein